MKRLTQAEVEALPVGTRVYVKWSGGNGPYWYIMGADKWGNRTIDTDFRGRNVVMDHVSNAFIGAKAPWTTVDVEEKDE